jgi:hypothetical protein
VRTSNNVHKKQFYIKTVLIQNVLVLALQIVNQQLHGTDISNHKELHVKENENLKKFLHLWSLKYKWGTFNKKF